MAPGDPRDFYATLGVHPSATPALIKAAYRVRAMELHPDRNPGAAATAAFQTLQQAFEVLSDPRRRADYDTQGTALNQQAQRAAEAAHVEEALRAARSTTRARVGAPEKPRDTRAGMAGATPARCSRCDAVPTLPRYRCFWEVRAFFSHTAQTTHKGVFCPRCETLVALRATSGTLLFGWWSATGLTVSPEVLVRNLFGGTVIAQEDARLLVRQAQHFQGTQQPVLARTAARQAHRIMRTAHMAHPFVTQVHRWLRRQPPDPLHDLKREIQTLLDATAGAKELRLWGTARVWNPRFSLQLVLWVLVAMGAMHLLQAALKPQRVPKALIVPPSTAVAPAGNAATQPAMASQRARASSPDSP